VILTAGHCQTPAAGTNKHTIAEVTALVKTRLKRMQYRPALLTGFLAKQRARVRTVPVTPVLNDR